MNTSNPYKEVLLNQINQVVTKSPSALMIWLRPVVKEIGEGSLIFEFTVSPIMINPGGTMHGGVISAVMDDMIGATILCLGKANLYTTVSNVIDYMAPARLGEVVTGKTEIIKLGKQIINVQFELWNMNKKRLLARGYSNNLKTEFLVPKFPPSENSSQSF